LFFIGHDSPLHLPSLQQSQLSQDAVSMPEAFFFFSGHESPLQQQHAAASEVWDDARVYA